MKKLLLFCSLFLVSINGYSKINPSNRTIELTVESYINNAPIGQVTLSISPSDEFALPWPEVEESFDKFMYPNEVGELRSLVTNQIITGEQLQQLGIVVDFDMASFSLYLSIPSALVKPQALSLKRKPRNLKVSKQAKISGYLNWYANAIRQKTDTAETDQQLNSRFESVVNISNVVFENEYEYFSSSNSTDAHGRRTSSRIIYDLPEYGTRLSLGDNYGIGSYFQSSVRFLGLALARDFSMMSDRQIKPTASQSFTLESTSSVEIIVSGVVVDRLNLSPGVYSLNDIPIEQGSNQIRLRITDSAGITRVVDFDVTTGLDLLAEGELEYRFNLGIPSTLAIDGLEYLTDEPFVSSYFDYGVSPSWTIGASLQANSYTQQLTAKNILAIELGQVSFEGALSYAEDLGSAFRFVYQNFTNGSSSNHNISLGYEYLSEDFTALKAEPNSLLTVQTIKHTLQGNYNYYFGESMQFGLSARLQQKYQEDEFTQAYGVSTSGPFSKGWRWGLRANWDNLNEQSDLNFALSINYRFDQNTRYNLALDTRNDKQRLDYSYTGNQQFVDSKTVRLGLERNDTQQAAIDFNAQYNANRFLIGADHASDYTQLDESGIHQSRVNFSTALAFAETDIAFGKPISDSFALVQAHQSIQDKNIKLGRSQEYYRAANDQLGPILFSDINSYDETTLAIDIDDLEPGYDLGSGILAFKSSYKSGYTVTIGSNANITVVAKVIAKDGLLIAAAVGTARCPEQPEFKEKVFFTNKKGRFAITGLIPCDYVITWTDKTLKEFKLTIVDGEQLQRLGEIHVQ